MRPKVFAKFWPAGEFECPGPPVLPCDAREGRLMEININTHTEAIAESIAREFHAEYEALAPSFGYETRHESAVPWEDVPVSNRALMIAVVGRLLERSVIADAR